MRRGSERQERPPRVGAAMLLKAFLGVLVVFVCTGAGVAGAGYFKFKDVVDEATSGPAPPPVEVADEDLPEVKPGGPRTLLVLGSDRRNKNATDSKLGQEPHSDTIVLVRLDPKRNRVAVLSLPRDLAVSIPGYGDGVKINQAYDEGGPALTLKTVKHLFESATGEPFEVNSVIDVNFRGFQRAVDYVHGVYVDVDRRYYNPPGTGFAEIDIQPGYQRLRGEDALAYVRYRHSDSDLYRNVRQQEFLRQAASQPEVRELQTLDDALELVKVFRRYFAFDRKFTRTRNLAGLLKTAVYLTLNDAPINQVKLRGITDSEDPAKDTRLFVSLENVKAAYKDFMTGTRSENPKRSDEVKVVKKRRKDSAPSGLVNARRAGEDMAVLATRKLNFPFYFPELVTSPSRFANDTPRVYRLRNEQGRRRQAYRIVISIGVAGEFYGVQGTAWRHPPILAEPDRIRKVDGRKLLLFYDGKKLRMVGWRTSRAAYWVTNTLGRKLSNAQLVAITRSLRRLNS